MIGCCVRNEEKVMIAEEGNWREIFPQHVSAHSMFDIL